jgi:Spy/CpxP family protein refolding chaperone
MLILQRKEVISMKKAITFGFCVILTLALVATVALAWGPGFGPWFGRAFGGPGNGVPPIPNLTAEQSVQIQALRDGFLKDIEPLREELYTKATEIRSLWAAPTPDATAVTAKQKEISELQSTLQEKGTALGLEIRKVLTPDQLAQLPAFSQNGTFGPGAGFGPRGFGPPMGMGGPFGRW